MGRRDDRRAEIQGRVVRVAPPIPLGPIVCLTVGMAVTGLLMGAILILLHRALHAPLFVMILAGWATVTLGQRLTMQWFWPQWYRQRDPEQRSANACDRMVAVTVQRHAEILVPSDIRAVSAMIRDILVKNSTYRMVSDQNNGTIFITTVKPSWWLMGTTMTITLSSHGSETRVVAEIRSQPWIMGDAFGFYPRYIRAFMVSIVKSSGKLG